MDDSTPNAWRKAAVLLVSLDPEAADALLDQMPPRQAERVRAAVLELDDVDPQEQEAVIAEFLGRRPDRVSTADRPLSSARNAVPPDGDRPRLGVELDQSLARRMQYGEPESSPEDGNWEGNWDGDWECGPAGTERLSENGVARDRPVEMPVAAPETGAPRTPLASLCRAEAGLVAGLLSDEPPQVAALVLAHLPPRKTAEILARLEGPVRDEVERRMMQLTAADPILLDQIEQQLESRLARSSRNGNSAAGVFPDGRNTAGGQFVRHRAAVTENVDARGDADSPPSGSLPPGASGPLLGASGMSPAVGPPWHGDLGPEGRAQPVSQPARSASTTRPLPSFQRLMELDDHGLAVLLEAADPDVALLSLAAADTELVQRVMRPLPPRQAAALRRRMSCLGPLPLSDLEESQRRLVRLAVELAQRQQIHWTAVSSYPGS